MYTWEEIIEMYRNRDLPELEKQGEMFWTYINGKLDKLIVDGEFELDVKDYEFTRVDGHFKTLRWLESSENYDEGYLGEEYKKLEARIRFIITVDANEIVHRCNLDTKHFDKKDIIEELRQILSHGVVIELEDELRKVEFGKEINDPKIIKLIEKMEKAIDLAYKIKGEIRGDRDKIPSFLKHTSPHVLRLKDMSLKEGRINAEYDLRIIGWDSPVNPGDTDRRIQALTRLGILAYDKTRNSGECINYFTPDGVCSECPRNIECEIDYKVENGLEDEIDGYWDNYEEDYEELNKNYW